MSFDIDGLRAANDLAVIAGHYTKLTRKGGEWHGCCPVHGGDNPTAFTIYVKDGVQLWHCFTRECQHDFPSDVIGFIQGVEGLDFKGACEFLGGKHDWKPQLSAPPRPKLPERVTSKPPADAGVPDMAMRQLGAPSRVWTYPDADGVALGYVARYDTPAGKEIRCWTWGARGADAPEWACGHWSKPRPLYGLDLLAKRADAAVLVVEGEKAADAARGLLKAYVSVTWPGGAHAWRHANWEPLRGRRVVLWPDNDKPGREAMAGIADALARGLGCSVKVIDPSDQPEGADAADWTGTGDELLAWARAHVTEYKLPDAAPAPAHVTESDAPGVSAPERTEGASLPGNPPAASDHVPEPQETPFLGDPPPDHADIPPEPGTTPERPRRKRGPRLTMVRGNAALAPDPDPDGDPLPAKLSEDHLAERFVERFGADWRYVKRWNRWFKWTGNTWDADTTENIYAVAKLIPRAAIYEQEAMALTADGKRKLTARRTVGAIEWFARSHRTVAATVEQWDTRPFLVGCPSGTIDLESGKIVESTREDYITRHVSVTPASGDCPLWLSFLRDVCRGDGEMVGYLQRFCGYALSGDVTSHALLYLFGTGGNGKGVFVDTLAAIMGSGEHGYAYACSVNVFLSAKAERHPTELAALMGARLIHAEEPDGGAHWDEGRIKWLTGEGTVTARFLGQEFFSFKLTGKILLQGNNKPRLKSVDDAMKRRFHIVPFQFRPEVPDMRLREKLRAEYPQILAWAMRGFTQWREIGLAPPRVITDATREYLDTEDAIGAFLAECCELSPDYEVDATDAYQRYSRWAESVGEPTYGRRRWSTTIIDRNLAPIPSRRSSGRTILRGFRLNESAPAQYYDRD